MVQLTPLEKTVAGKELIYMGKEVGLEKGREVGRKEGELIGKIVMLQRFMKYTAYTRDTLLQKKAEELQVILDQLEAKIQ